MGAADDDPAAADVAFVDGGLFDFDDLEVVEVAKKASPASAVEREQTSTSVPSAVLASDVLAQLELELQGQRRRAPPAARHGREVPPLPLRGGRQRVGPAESSGVGTGEERLVTVDVASGEVREGGEHLASASLEPWLTKAREWLQRFNPKAQAPSTFRLPATALDWEPAAAVLFVLTHGQFDPRRDVPNLGEQPRVRDPGLVSVVCATSDRHRTFHSLLYDNFAGQTYEPRELVVVHAGEMPSDFFQERAREDPRVVYRFFPVASEAPGSPRLTDERAGNPLAAILREDDRREVLHWGAGDNWTHEIVRAGWTKGLKRNIANCIARGAAIAHFDDGCLYAPSYLEHMRWELCGDARPGDIPQSHAAVTLAQWHTVAIADQDFRWVDLDVPDDLWQEFGGWTEELQEKDMYSYGFAYVYARSAWERFPFSDIDTVGTQDGDFMESLRSSRQPVGIVRRERPPETLAACGWHRDATCGSRDHATNITHSQVLYFYQYRGRWVKKPKAFRHLLKGVKEAAAELLARRERFLKELVEEHGSVYVCAWCNFAVAQRRRLTDASKRMKIVRWIENRKVEMTFEIGEFSRAGGAVAEGPASEVNAHGPNPWLAGHRWRRASCRNCGLNIGFRYEPSETAADPEAPVFWGLIWRYVRERSKPGEHVPKEWNEWDPPRHAETKHNFKKNTVCPQGHRLGRFCPVHYFQAGGGSYAGNCQYVCDVCDRPAKDGGHLSGCGTCDYDMCDHCREKRG